MAQYRLQPMICELNIHLPNRIRRDAPTDTQQYILLPAIQCGWNCFDTHTSHIHSNEVPIPFFSSPYWKWNSAENEKSENFKLFFACLSLPNCLIWLLRFREQFWTFDYSRISPNIISYIERQVIVMVANRIKPFYSRNFAFATQFSRRSCSIKSSERFPNTKWKY